MTEPSYAQARKERFADTVCEYIDDDSAVEVFAQDLKECLSKEHAYYQKQADKCLEMMLRFGL